MEKESRVKEVELPKKLAIHVTHKQAILLNMLYTYGAFSFTGDIAAQMIMHTSLMNFLTFWTHEEKEEMAKMVSSIADLVPEEVKKEFGCNGIIRINT